MVRPYSTLAKPLRRGVGHDGEVISLLFVLPLQIRDSRRNNPYSGIVIFLVLPIIFFAGLALIPLGLYLSRRRIQKEIG